MANPKPPAGAPTSPSAKPASKPAAPTPPPLNPEPAPIAKLYRSVDWLTFFLTTLLVLVGYLYTIAPDLTLEDSGELAVGSMYAGVPHPPGYPVWTIYTWAFTKFLPISNIAFRVAVSSAVAAALSAGLVGLLISRGSSLILESIDSFKALERKWENPLCLVSGLAGGLLIGFNGFIWSQAVIVEVYTLAVLTFMAMLAFLMRWLYAPQQRRYLYWAFFMFGLCFCNHQTLIVAAIGIEVLALMGDRRLGRDFFFANALVYTLVMLGRAHGKTAMLSDNVGVFHVFNFIGLASWVVAFAYSGKLEQSVRNLAVGAASIVALLGFTALITADGNVVSLTAAVSQAVAEGKNAADLGRSLEDAKSFAALMIPALGYVSLAGLIAVFAMSYNTERSGRLLSEWKPVLLSGVIFLLGAAFYFYMPLASMTNPPMNWGYPRTWEGFIHAFTRGQYEKTNPSTNPLILIQQVSMYFQGAKEEFNWANLLVALVPFGFLTQMKSRERGWLIGLTGIYVTLAFLLLILLNPGITRQDRELVKVFFTSSHTIIALGVGYGLSIIGALLLTQYQNTRFWLMIGGAVACAFNLFELVVVWNETVFTILRAAAALSLVLSAGFVALVLVQRERVALAPFLLVFSLVPFDSILSHWSDNEQRGHLYGYWFGHDMFEPGMDAGRPAPKDKDGQPLYPSMARDAVLFGGTDPGRFCPTYMIFCESFIPPEKRLNPKFDRRDVVLITQNALADNTYLDYIRAHYNKSAQVDPPFFYGMLNDAKSAQRGRTNWLAQLAAPVDRFFTEFGASIEKERRASSSLFAADHFADLNAFQGKLTAAADPLSKFLKEALGAAATGDAKTLATGLNRLLEGPSLFEPARFAGVKLSDRVQKFAQQNPPTFNRIRLNRLLLEEAYPGAFKPSAGGLYPDREIITPTVEDASRSFTEYSQDAARRYSLGQLDPGEQVMQLPDGRISVQGQVAVMNINGLLTKVIFDANPNHEFYIEESFPLKWMHPHLVPYGIIMKIEREPQAMLTDEQLRRDHEYWSQYAERFIGNWITYDTTPKEVCDFALKTYQLRDLTGFKGDPTFVRDDNAQKAFSKLRNAIGKSVYGWRAQHHAKNGTDAQRYLKEAEFALKQAFAFCPYSPETVFNYASLLAGMGRYEDAYQVAETCYAFDRDNAGVADLARQLDQLRKNAGSLPANKSINELAADFRANPVDITNAFQIAGSLYQMGRSNEAISVLDAMMTNPGTDANALLNLAEGYRQMMRADRMAETLTQYVKKAPDAPEGWFDLAALQAALNKPADAGASLANAFRLSDARKATNPASRDLRAVYGTDPRFNAVRAVIDVK
jgi:Flp pilus assembly protein TadD